MTFATEAAFEKALIAELSNKGWEKGVIKNPTEADLLKNWADILFHNNREIDRLNDVPLSDTEMQQIVEQIRSLKTPLKLNGFINGKSVKVTRDNPADSLHFGKEISLKIYDRKEIAAGQSRYQIVQQPRFEKAHKILNDRRGDVMLLINGMPLIHIELKRSGVPISNATNQIENYAAEGVFSGLFSLVQIFVAMSPDDMVYFANPGPGGKFNRDFYFNWADFNNIPVKNWKAIASQFLSIPMAHQLIGFYTVADASDGILKVMRSYQYYAANAISDKVSKINWGNKDRLGGYIWHTTGSGKTMTSFKSAQLIAYSKDADKVVFLMDRIELGVQSLEEYQNFASDGEMVQKTQNTGVLVTKLKSTKPADTLIVTSIQKMSNIKTDANAEGVSFNSDDVEKINQHRLVIIVDEAHRSTFGNMLIDIKRTFPTAIFFGFTGTPVEDENKKKDSTTAMVFGDELHKYSIAHGIRDKNVLGFDPYKVMTYRDRDLREAVALDAAKVSTVAEALEDPKKAKVYHRFMNDLKMVGHKDATGNYIRGIEDYLPREQYEREEHQNQVVSDIVANWISLSRNSKFHALFATSSIPEAIVYYRLFKKLAPTLKITALFDPNIDEGEGDFDKVQFKKEGLIEIISDYNEKYGLDFSLQTHAKFKKDVAARLAHKKPYLRIEHTPDDQLDLLIVVDQMLTGFDSKWLNTLYLDKVLQYENIIQAFSRTNRLYVEHEKPFGTIRYYRKPHTMERNINNAIKLYSGDKPKGLFVDKLPENMRKMNVIYTDIAALFTAEGITNFGKLPDDWSVCGQFAKLFKSLNDHLEAAEIQGFTFADDAKGKFIEKLIFDENTYLILAMRYKELSSGSGGGRIGDIPFAIAGHLTEIDTDRIDADYMNNRFSKFLIILQSGGEEDEEMATAVEELQKTFASLTQDEQKIANIFLNDVRRGAITPDEGKTFKDYIAEYLEAAKIDQINNVVKFLGFEGAEAVTTFKEQLTRMVNSGITDTNINEFGRFDALKECVDKAKAKTYFESVAGNDIAPFKVAILIDKSLRSFILTGNFSV